MLRELRIENLLVIERAELRFGAGLNAITGETGAGKTMLTHALDLLMGAKARPNVVRPGASEAYVEGVFEMPEGLFDEPEVEELAERVPDGAEDLVLARRVSASGRTSAFVGGRSATAADLNALGSRLLAFYGQHEHRRLTLASAQLGILDGFIGTVQMENRARCRSLHRQVLEAERELASLVDREGSRERDLDLLRFELGEIESCAPEPEEPERLSAERETLRHAERIAGACWTAGEALAGADQDGSARASAAAAAGVLADVREIDAEVDLLAERAEALVVELEDLAGELHRKGAGLEADPMRLEEVEERLELLDRLRRKHGGTIESVLAHARHCSTEIEQLESSEEASAELADRVARLRAEREELGEALARARHDAAPGLESAVAEELSRLAMPEAGFEVRITDHPDGCGATGRDQVEMLVATNPGMAPAPLRDAASGGELSRVMLALTGVAQSGSGPTIVFDEIDAGIGGKTAKAVGERLRELGRRRQVICVTHLPQVAAVAGTHFSVAKSLEDGASTASVDSVADRALVSEIVRMLGGDAGDEAARRHAEELLAA